jgi:hypothetical protein
VNPDPIVGKSGSLVLGKGIDPEPASGGQARLENLVGRYL